MSDDKIKTVTVRVTEEVHNKIREICFCTKESMQIFIEKAIIDKINKENMLGGRIFIKSKRLS